MVEHQRGDLLDYPFGINVICHVCNNVGVMGSGIALSIKQRYPAAYETYRVARTLEDGSSDGGYRMGDWSQAEVAPGRLILNLVAQNGYGRGKRHLDYEAFYKGLDDIHSTLRQFAWNPAPVVGMPHLIGSDRAGGSFKVVLAMIEDIFEASPIRCVIVRLPDVAA